MAVVAQKHVQPSRINTYPFTHDVDAQDDRLHLPFLYPPRQSPLRDSRKAQRMLGLVTEFPSERAQRVRLSQPHPKDSSKAQKTLGLVAVTESPRVKRWESEFGRRRLEERLERKLEVAEREVRRLSGLAYNEQEAKRAYSPVSPPEDQVQSPEGEWIRIGLEQRQREEDGMRYEEQPAQIPLLQSLELLPPQASPVIFDELQLSPEAQSHLRPPPLVVPARPASFTASHLHDRPTNKIASSRWRGLRANSYPNFSRPLSGIAPRPVAGEDIEQDPPYMKFHDDEVGPPSPTSPIASPIVFEENIDTQKKTTEKGHRPRKNRWHSLPLSLIRLGKRRASKAEDDALKEKQDTQATKFDLTEENLQRWEDEVGYVPKSYRLGFDMLVSPVEPDMQVERGTPDLRMLQLPELQRFDDLTLSPPTSPPLAQQSSVLSTTAQTGSLLTPNKQSASATPTTSIMHTPSSLQGPPMYLTCTVCHEPQPPSNFPIRHISSTCAHAQRTCSACIQRWIETCISMRGWDQCTCPECGQPLSYDDIRTFASEDGFRRYEGLATRAALSTVPNFYWCQRPGCTSGHILSAPADENPVFVCEACGYKYCVHHSTVPFHAGETCAQYDARLSSNPDTAPAAAANAHAEREGLRKVQEIGKRCPNALCGWWIEKNEGCDHMTCWKCRFEFCWECGGYMRLGTRKLHREGCRYGR